MELTREQFNKAATEFMMNYGDDEDESQIRDDYSGRGMYGRTCVGVVGDRPSAAVQFMYCLAEVIHEDDLDDQKDFVLEMSEALTMDNMGRSAMIYYFPGYKIVED